MRKYIAFWAPKEIYSAHFFKKCFWASFCGRWQGVAESKCASVCYFAPWAVAAGSAYSGSLDNQVPVRLLCAACANRRFDRWMLGGTTALMSVNYVIWVAAGQYFLAYKLKLFPIWGYENWTYLMLPVLIGVVSGLGPDVRFYRTVVLDEMRKPYVRTALAKGLSPARILFRHILKNSLAPVVTNVSLAVPFLFTGSILLESFFGIPGLGGIGLNAVHASDYPTVRAVVVIGAVLYQLSNLAADLICAWLDPQFRLNP